MENEVTGKGTGWQWCGQCGRASQSESAFSCGYDDCDGYIGNLWTWEYVRKTAPWLPEIPEANVVYSLNKE